MMEEAPAAEPVVTEDVNADETPAEPEAEPEAASEAEPEAEPDEPAEAPAEPEAEPEAESEAEPEAEPVDAVDVVEELIAAEALEAAPVEAMDVELEQPEEVVDEPRELEEMDLTEDDDPSGINFAASFAGSGSVTIDKTSFPDDAFRAYISKNISSDGKTLTAQELSNTKSIDLSAWPDKAKITSLEGISVFRQLQTLNVSGCTGLTDLSRFEYDANGNASKVILPESIKKLNASNCTNLKEMQCGESEISELDVTGCTNLEELSCAYTRNMTTLDVSTCTNLKRLYIHCGSLKTLPDLSKNTKLEDLQCAELGLTALNVSAFPSLKRLGCGGNGLTELNVSPCANLVELNCWGNAFSELDLSNNKKLAELWCEGNSNLKKLDISNCEVLAGAVDPSAPTDIPNTNPVVVGYGSYVDKWGENWYRLTCDKGVEVITKKAEEPAPAPAPAPAAPVIPTIAAVKKNSRATFSVAPGTVFQLDLGGVAGTKFKSSNKKVAGVDANGLVTMKKAGKTTISFKVGKKTRKVKLTFKDSTIPAYVAITPPASTAVKKGDTVALVPVVPEGTDAGGFKWKSTNKKVATVKDGVVTFKKKGKVTIICTAKRGKKKAKIKFSVSK